MTYLEAAKRIEEHMKIHFEREYPHAMKITEALEMAVKLLHKADRESKASLCLLRCEDRCSEYCDGWNIYEDCYVPSEGYPSDEEQEAYKDMLEKNSVDTGINIFDYF